MAQLWPPARSPTSPPGRGAATTSARLEHGARPYRYAAQARPGDACVGLPPWHTPVRADEPVAAEIDPDRLGLVRLFTDFSLLGDLFVRPYNEWGASLRDVGANLDHVEDADIPAGDVYEQMATDVLQLARRIALLADPPTEAGRVVAKIGRKPRKSRTLDDDRLLRETLTAQIHAHYRGYWGISLVDLIQDGARRLARVPGHWQGYCPGLLLGELRRLIEVAHADAGQARRFVAELARIRISVVDELQMRRPDRELTRLGNMVAYADAINSHHLRALAETDQANAPSITMTEARATAILLTFAGLLVQLQTLGPVQCLGAPASEAPPPASPLDPVPVTLSDGSVWDCGMQAGMVALLMMYLMNDEFTVDERVIFKSLGINTQSRGVAEKVFRIARRNITGHRKINKGLAMELLSSLLLARLDSTREVLCNCETNHGLPYGFAPGGLTDVEAVYESAGVTLPEFQVIAAVSAKSEVTRTFYREQLEQALRHGKELAGRTGLRVYALILNGGDTSSDAGLRDVFHRFVESKKVARDGTVRLVPMYAPSLASAVRDLEAGLPPDAFRFEADLLAVVLDMLIDEALAPGPNADPEWTRNVWMQVLGGEEE